MLDLERPKYLALDRTNWKLGSRDINILMLAIVTRRFRVPLLFSLLPHQGNSDTGHRIALMRRYLSLFPAASIRCLLADREFIGVEWMDFLNENNIPFAIRVRIDMTVTLEDGRTWSIATLLRRRRARCATLVGHINGTAGATREPVRLAAKHLGNGEWLIVATNRPDPKQALNDYRKRWGIECLFGDTKTRGLNIEDTHITNPEKLASLIVVLSQTGESRTDALHHFSWICSRQSRDPSRPPLPCRASPHKGEIDGVVPRRFTPSKRKDPRTSRRAGLLSRILLPIRSLAWHCRGCRSHRPSGST